MKLIVGLGNPGKKYEHTRHNVGFIIIETLAKEIGKEKWQEEKKFTAEIIKTTAGKETVVLAKPLTFMNLSGEAIKKIASYYKIKTSDIWIIHDDADLPFGKIKIGQFKSSAGHNGLKSTIENLGSTDFLRIRFGIGRPTNPEQLLETFVLEKFSTEEQKTISVLSERVTKELLATLLSS
jgi:PTH1 family peptidyl-tRNA hydrolase